MHIGTDHNYDSPDDTEYGEGSWAHNSTHSFRMMTILRYWEGIRQLAPRVYNFITWPHFRYSSKNIWARLIGNEEFEFKDKKIGWENNRMCLGRVSENVWPKEFPKIPDYQESFLTPESDRQWNREYTGTHCHRKGLSELNLDSADTKGLVWGCTPLIPVLWKWRHVDVCEFEATSL